MALYHFWILCVTSGELLCTRFASWITPDIQASRRVYTSRCTNMFPKLRLHLCCAYMLIPTQASSIQSLKIPDLVSTDPGCFACDFVIFGYNIAGRFHCPTFSPKYSYTSPDCPHMLNFPRGLSHTVCEFPMYRKFDDTTHACKKIDMAINKQPIPRPPPRTQAPDIQIPEIYSLRPVHFDVRI